MAGRDLREIYPVEYFWEQLRQVLARSDEKQRDLSKVGISYRLRKEDFLREHRRSS